MRTTDVDNHVSGYDKILETAVHNVLHHGRSCTNTEKHPKRLDVSVFCDKCLFMDGFFADGNVQGSLLGAQFGKVARSGSLAEKCQYAALNKPICFSVPFASCCPRFSGELVEVGRASSSLTSASKF